MKFTMKHDHFMANKRIFTNYKIWGLCVLSLERRQCEILDESHCKVNKVVFLKESSHNSNVSPSGGIATHDKTSQQNLPKKHYWIFNKHRNPNTTPTEWEYGRGVMLPPTVCLPYALHSSLSKCHKSQVWITQKWSTHPSIGILSQWKPF